MQTNTHARLQHPPVLPETLAHLAPLNYLQTPVWVYIPAHWRQAWANVAALRLWNCATLEDFLAKDFRDNSEATERFFSALPIRIAKAEMAGLPGQVKTMWTIYPHGKPIVTQMTFSSLPLPPPYKDTPAVLVEAIPQDTVLGDTLRSLEALRQLTTMVTLYDRYGNIVLQNNTALTELPLEPAAPATSLDEKSLLPHVRDRCAIHTLVQTVFEKGEQMCTQVKVRLPHGKRYHQLTALRLADPITGGHLILVQEEDVTATVREQKGTAAHKLANKLKDDFLANTSHELRTPLHGIIGLTEELLADTHGSACAQDAATRHALSVILASGQRMNSLVNDLLLLAKLSKVGKQLDRRELDARAVIAPVISLASGMLEAKEIDVELRADIAEDVSPVYADEHKLQQILITLMSSVIENGLESGTTVDIISVRNFDSKRVLFSVVGPHGPCLPREELNRLFEPFYKQAPYKQAGNLAPSQMAAEDARLGRTTLGFAITKKLIELHDGKIWAEPVEHGMCARV